MKKKSLHKPSYYLEGFKQSAIVFFLSLAIVISNQAGVFASTGNQDNQDRTISGVVSDSQGLSLPGVNVRISGTSRGTTTDIDGKYSINQIEDGQTLIFSFIGMISQEINPLTAKSFNIVLLDDAQGLEEVVIVGYGSMQRKQITSSVSTVDSESLQRKATTSPIQLLQGKVAGLTISRPSGSDPTASPTIMIRGNTSLRGYASPLIIVNGVEVSSLDIISPEDIETFSVLKDGSAAAIYGSRGTNGVIIITTKEGKKGVATVEYSGYASFEQVYNKPDLLTADEFRTLGNKLSKETGDASTDWYDELLQTSRNYTHNIAISGGSAKTKYRASIEHSDVTGIVLESFKKRLNGRININHKAINDRLNVKADLSASQTRYRAPDYGAFSTAVTMNPTQSIYNEDGTYQYFTERFRDNPIASIKNKTHDNAHKILLSSIYADFKIIDGLKIGGRLAWKIEDWNIGEYESRLSERSLENSQEGYAKREAKFSYRDNYELNANYRKQIGKHEFSGMVNWTYEKDIYETMLMENRGFATDAFLYNSIESGSFLKDPDQSDYKMDTYKQKVELESYRARMVYSYDNKYMVTGSVNCEGSSVFGKNNKWGTFFGLSGGWTITEEGFMKDIPEINYLKLRIGYGETGNAGASPYSSLARIGQEFLSYNFRGNPIVAYGLTNNPNPNLGWEKKAEINFGLDFAILDNVIDGSLDVYQRKTSDLLYRLPAALPSAVNDDLLTNIGDLYSEGIELSLNTKNITSENFSWTTSLNASYNQGKVEKLDLSSGSAFFHVEETSLGSIYKVETGEPLGNFYGKRFDRIDENGKWVFKDLNKNGEIDEGEGDKEILGNGAPKYHIGFTNSLKYKNFNLDIFFRSALDFDVINYGKIFYENITKFPNSNVYATTGQNGLKDAPQYSDYYLEKGDYIKLENISLSYNFDVKNINYISSARLYVSCSNVFTITKYSGLTPDLEAGGTRPGLDGLNFYPVSRTFTIGAAIKF
ncbi:TonB-dependent receptor [Ancylomarina euxinus]|uniref:TonB-dependent receptor n=1 Tax=Ancylomarina euxinus TaxID=2283627 RepID=A0A425XXK4_9BACT|nr:TonB-dependent receptor [Ancylomarina euxinus]MCZ4694722.1 TonB-dependent receptor [Ancylomarina euxinus]MUP16386.1 SusC/RagA family TonB-linked outer membrane protein [Ancylomarina euxinus]RRG19417.1 TonB-dependent receptor [Ancylomarina euxinus]